MAASVASSPHYIPTSRTCTQVQNTGHVESYNIYVVASTRATKSGFGESLACVGVLEHALPSRARGAASGSDFGVGGAVIGRMVSAAASGFSRAKSSRAKIAALKRSSLLYGLIQNCAVVPKTRPRRRAVSSVMGWRSRNMRSIRVRSFKSMARASAPGVRA